MTRREDRDWLADDEGNLRPEIAEMLLQGGYRSRPTEGRNPPRSPGRGLSVGARRVLGVAFITIGLLMGSNAAHRERWSPRPHTTHVPVVARSTEASREGQQSDRPLQSTPVSQPIAKVLPKDSVPPRQAAEAIAPKPVQQEVELSTPRPTVVHPRERIHEALQIPRTEDLRIATATKEDWRLRAWMKDRARSRVKTRPVTRVEARPTQRFIPPPEVRIVHVRHGRPAYGAPRVPQRVIIHRSYGTARPVRVWASPRHRVPPRWIPGPQAQVRHLKKGRR